MITRHHVSLGLGSMAILYFPLFFTNPWVIAAVSAGVCTGVLLPDIHMKKPTRSRWLYAAWFVVQLFKKTAVRLYLVICRNVFRVRPDAEDKRLTHSIPGLIYLTALVGIPILLAERAFPGSAVVGITKIVLAGLIIGLLLHFVEDICTKKGMSPFFPFSESFRVSGSIRPCNKDDMRIRLFHVHIAVVIAGILALYCCGLCPASLEWPLSIGAFAVCTFLMIRHSEVKVTCLSDPAAMQREHHPEGSNVPGM
jgi:hypothetical protein